MGDLLLVFALDEGHLGLILLQRLAQTNHVTVAEDAGDTLDEPALLAVHIHILLL